MKKRLTKGIALALCFCSVFVTSCNRGDDSSTPQHQHAYTQEKAEESYLKEAASCTSPAIYYKSCECGEKGGDQDVFISGSKIAHDYTAQVESAEYFKTAATCMQGAEYYKSCTMCGKKGYSFNTFYSETLGSHAYTEENHDAKYIKEEATFDSPAIYYKSCICGQYGEETFTYGEKLKEYTEAEKLEYTPTSLTMTMYDAKESVYGFTYNTLKEPLRPVLQIAKGKTLGEEYEEYAGTVEAMSSLNEDNSSLNYYIVKIEADLEPSTEYTYRVYDKYVEVGKPTATFTTGNPTSSAFSFIHVSDSQMHSSTGDYFGDILSQAAESNDFILHTGDIVQTAKYEYEWTDMLDDNYEYLSTIPMMAIAGNHEGDYATHQGVKELYKHFHYKYATQDTTQGIYYSFVYGNAKFIMLNANARVGSKLAAAQYEWLENELKNNDATWTIVAMHQPMYSPGKWGSGAGYDGVSKALRAQLRGLFAEYGVDLVLQGHDHVISRTHPINGLGEPTEETWQEVGGVKYSVDPDGVIYVMNGPAGGQTRTPEAAAESEYYQYMKGSNARSYAEITIDGNKLTLSAKSIGGSGSTAYAGCTWGIQKSA